MRVENSLNCLFIPVTNGLTELFAHRLGQGHPQKLHRLNQTAGISPQRLPLNTDYGKRGLRLAKRQACNRQNQNADFLFHHLDGEAGGMIIYRQACFGQSGTSIHQ